MNAVSFSLFGYKGNLSSAYPFASYFRGVSFNMKMIELIYPGWKMHLILDEPTFEHFKEYFDYHVEGGRLAIEVIEPDELCMMMLQRMRPIFSGDYDRVICRDLDSLVSYKERQAVEYWMSTGKIAHAITDSVSHTIPLMGGMVGFMCKEFREIFNVDFKSFVRRASRIKWGVKGADQDFLNQIVLPKVADPNKPSIVEHYLLGMPQSFRGECHHIIQDITLPDVKPMLEESNKLIEHIGADGFRQDQALVFFDKHFTPEQKEYYNLIEDQFKEVFYWRNEI